MPKFPCFFLLALLVSGVVACRATVPDRQSSAATRSSERVQEGVLVSALPIRLVPAQPRQRLGDEIDVLEDTVAPPSRFAEHRPQFTVEQRRFTFAMAPERSETRTWQVVRDGDRVIALLRSGDILLLADDPASAPRELKLPTERLHLDNLPGPSLPTHQGVGRVATHGAIYDETAGAADTQEHWEGDGTTLTLVRQRATDALRIHHRFTFSCDPVYGYRIDADQRLAFAAQPDAKARFNSGTFCPGTYVPWPESARYDRTVFTPADAPGWRGWANNLIAIDRCDADKNRFAWRDGGFIAHLPSAGVGWSHVRTRSDGFGAIRMQLCNAHNDFHIHMPYPEVAADADGWRHYHLRHRLMHLPPEMTRVVWDEMDLQFVGQEGIIIGLGATETFDAQPVPLTQPQRGLVWSSRAPPLRPGLGRDGSQALEIRGRQWPNLPQISLIPGVTYRIEGWYLVRHFTAEELTAAQEQEGKRHAALAKAGKPVPAATDWTQLRPRAWIAADYYQWSPHTEAMLATHRTTEATALETWQRVSLDLTAPDWGPALNVAFICHDGVALLDDLTIAPLQP